MEIQLWEMNDKILNSYVNNSDLDVVKKARESYLATVTEGSLMTITDLWQYLTNITSHRRK